jgi:hypothetical protein
MDGENPPMRYIYGDMDRTKKAVRTLYGGGGHEGKYGSLWAIVDSMWNRLHLPKISMQKSNTIFVKSSIQKTS